MILWCVQTLKACDEQNLKIANVMSTAATRGNANESVYCATKWGEKGYTQSLKAAYKGSSVTVVGVYPGGIDTDFYRESHDYVSLDKQHTFMPAADRSGETMPNIEPLISIIVPVYNSEKYLSRCIESILAQSFKNLEIIN